MQGFVHQVQGVLGLPAARSAVHYLQHVVLYALVWGVMHCSAVLCTVYSVTPVTSTFSAVISANCTVISGFTTVITTNYSDINVRWAVRWVLLKNK